MSVRGVAKHYRRSVELTPIQREILQHRADGRQVAEIRKLYPHLGPTSVRGQLQEAFKKLGAAKGNGVHAIAIAMRAGVIK